MRIEEQRIYTMYLSVEEFELMHSITSSVPYGYYYFQDKGQEEGEFIVQVKGEEMLYQMKEKLQDEQYNQEYVEYNSFKVDEIRVILNSIYEELGY
jgi:hypothetical protein